MNVLYFFSDKAWKRLSARLSARRCCHEDVEATLGVDGDTTMLTRRRGHDESRPRINGARVVSC
ncbi:MAG: hypothetical protein K2G11_01325 [Muribaculaceae bacterium]|nr:hypothetical protein [Muribaculaceae bacterium]